MYDLVSVVPSKTDERNWKSWKAYYSNFFSFKSTSGYTPWLMCKNGFPANIGGHGHVRFFLDIPGLLHCTGWKRFLFPISLKAFLKNFVELKLCYIQKYFICKEYFVFNKRFHEKIDLIEVKSQNPLRIIPKKPDSDVKFFKKFNDFSRFFTMKIVQHNKF